MTGLDFLKEIKLGNVPDKTVILVKAADKSFYMEYVNNDIIWKPNTFKLTMLCDDNISFEIMEI